MMMSRKYDYLLKTGKELMDIALRCEFIKISGMLLNME
jgi:hypothetical protein